MSFGIPRIRYLAHDIMGGYEKALATVLLIFWTHAAGPRAVFRSSDLPRRGKLTFYLRALFDPGASSRSSFSVFLPRTIPGRFLDWACGAHALRIVVLRASILRCIFCCCLTCSSLYFGRNSSLVEESSYCCRINRAEYLLRGRPVRRLEAGNLGHAENRPALKAWDGKDRHQERKQATTTFGFRIAPCCCFAEANETLYL